MTFEWIVVSALLLFVLSILLSIVVTRDKTK